MFDWALGGPSFGGPGKSKMAAWDAGGFKMAGVSAQYSILNFIGYAPTGGLGTSVLLSRFPAQYTLVPCTPPCTHMCNTRFMLGRGEGKGVATPPNVPILNPPGPICTCRRGKGVYSKDFARGRMFSNNDVAINIQS